MYTAMDVAFLLYLCGRILSTVKNDAKRTALPVKKRLFVMVQLHTVA